MEGEIEVERRRRERYRAKRQRERNIGKRQSKRGIGKEIEGKRQKTTNRGGERRHKGEEKG
jgi:hypothetical protein